ncbi:MAG: GntR family transcriptional regulator [Pseudomonadota bacterium]
MSDGPETAAPNTADAPPPEAGAPPVALGASSSINLTNLAYRSVAHMIQARRLRGGDIIVEARLAGVLGISRTPLREALQRLEGEGLVRKTANRSFVVRKVELQEYLESLKVREVLEPEAAALAVGRISSASFRAVRRELVALINATAYHTEAHWASDDNVHRLFSHACGNAVLSNTIEALRVTTRLFEINRLADRLGPDSEEHMAILDALEAADPALARRAVRNHIRSLTRYSTKLLL